MRIQDLHELISTARWFEKLGERGKAQDEIVWIWSIESWAGMDSGDPALEKVAEEMVWFPNLADARDAMGLGEKDELKEQAQVMGKADEAVREGLLACKMTYAAMNGLDKHPLLEVGPYDFFLAARDCALYAARQAAFEIVLEQPGLGCELIRIYHAGHWPCGRLPNGKVVVF
jgi:hypothetical protein